MPDNIDASQPLPNHRQELFCQYLSAGESKAQAYIKAGYKDTIHARVNCGHLWESDKVKQRTTYLQEQITTELHQIATEVTKDTLTKQIEAVIEQASGLNQTSSVVSALALLGKVHGLVTDKVETKDIPPELTKQEEQYQRDYAAWRLDQEAAKARANSGHRTHEDGPGQPNSPVGTIGSPKESIKLYGT